MRRRRRRRGRRFSIKKPHPIFYSLQAGLDAGLDLPHDCKMGVCMKCSSRMVRNERELEL